MISKFPPSIILVWMTITDLRLQQHFPNYAIKLRLLSLATLQTLHECVQVQFPILIALVLRHPVLCCPLQLRRKKRITLGMVTTLSPTINSKCMICQQETLRPQIISMPVLNPRILQPTGHVLSLLEYLTIPCVPFNDMRLRAMHTLIPTSSLIQVLIFPLLITSVTLLVY